MKSIQSLALAMLLGFTACEPRVELTNGAASTANNVTKQQAQQFIDDYVKSTNILPMPLDANNQAGFGKDGAMILFHYHESTQSLDVTARVTRFTDGAGMNADMWKILQEIATNRYANQPKRLVYLVHQKEPIDAILGVAQTINTNKELREQLIPQLGAEANWWLDTGVRQAADRLHAK
jgi:hypothetical protein